jgi:hypothetical protein
MWGSVLGGLIGAVVGGAATYFAQRKLEARRKHENTVKDIISEVKELGEMVAHLIGHAKFDPNSISDEISDAPLEEIIDIGENPFPRDARDKAKKIEMMATNLDDEGLKHEILKAMNQKYENERILIKSLNGLIDKLHREAYPAIQKVKRKHVVTAQELRGSDADEKWPGPANKQFLNKLYGEGVPSKTEWENKN